MAQENPNIVIFLRSMRFLGGHVVTYPLLHQLKYNFPTGSLTVVGTDPIAGHYETTPWVNRYVQAPNIHTKLKTLKDASHSFVLHYSSEQYALLTALMRTKIRVGFKNNRIMDFLWTHAPKKNGNDYIALANLKLLQCLKPFNPEEAALKCMQDYAALAKDRVAPTSVVFMPGGGAGAYKRWPLKSYLALVPALKNKLGQDTRFSIVTGPQEQEEMQTLHSLKRSDFNIVNNHSMPALADLCLQSQLIIANDCGPSHIAQLCGRPYVGVFHAPNPSWFWARKTARCITPPTLNYNINSIQTQHVLEGVDHVLAS